MVIKKRWNYKLKLEFCKKFDTKGQPLVISLSGSKILKICRFNSPVAKYWRIVGSGIERESKTNLWSVLNQP